MVDPKPPPGLCECGCGQPTKIARATDPRWESITGMPQRFIKGHNHRGANHYAWVEDPNYATIHAWLRNNCDKTGTCDECGKSARTEFALIRGREYSRNRQDYRELCKRCHNAYDNVGYGRYWAAKGIAPSVPPGPAPGCACGCAIAVQWDRRDRKWNMYADGHYRQDALYKDEAWLRRERTEQGRSLKDIAAELGVNRTTVSHFERKFGITAPRATPMSGAARRDPRPRPVLAGPVSAQLSCAHCLRPFLGRPLTGAERRFCSKACKAAWRRANGADDVTRNCHQCGGEFACNRYEPTSHCGQRCAAVCQHAGGCPR